jgi:hypothetical protein
MNGWDTDFSNAQGYGLFCGKKCVARKQAEGIPPKRGKKNIAAWEARQAEQQQAAMAASGGGGRSKAPIVIASLIGVALIVGIVVVIKRRNK